MSIHYVSEVVDTDGEVVRFVGHNIYGRPLASTGLSHYIADENASVSVAPTTYVNLAHIKIPKGVMGIFTWMVMYKSLEEGNTVGYREAFLNNDENEGTKVTTLGHGDKREPIGNDAVILSGACVGGNTDENNGKEFYLKTFQFSLSTLTVVKYMLKFTVLSGEIPSGWTWVE